MTNKRRSLTLNDVVLGNIRRRGKQNAILVLGVLLAVYFLSTSMFGASSLVASIQAERDWQFGRADFFLWGADEALMQELAAQDIVASWVEQEVLYASDMLGDARNESFTVGRYTPRVNAVQCYRLLDGRFPEKEGEIALNSSILFRLNTSAKVGDEITLTLHAGDGERASKETVEKAFTLVGVLGEKGKTSDSGQWHGLDSGNWERDREGVLFLRAPEALVSEEEHIQPGARKMHMMICSYVKGDMNIGSSLTQTLQAYRESTGRTVWEESVYHEAYGRDSLQSSGGLTARAGIAIAAALSIASMAGIANALTGSIERRKAQIGLLRAIGATQRQIRKILLRETLGIMVCALPLGIGLGCVTLKLMQRMANGFLVWYVPMWVVLTDALLCAVCIYLASMRPVRRSAKITPMQAVRDVDFARMFLWKDEKSKKKFVPQKLIARRNTRLRRGRTVGMTALLAAGALLFSFGVALSIDSLYWYQRIANEQDLYFYGGSGSLFGGFGGYGEYLNEAEAQVDRVSMDALMDVEKLPYIRRVEAYTEKSIVLLMDEIPDYVTVGHFNSRTEYLFPERSSTSRANALMEGRDISKPESKGYADYLATKRRFGIDQEILVLTMTGMNREELEKLQDYVIEGELNIDKVLSGEEVLVQAPTSVAMVFEQSLGFGEYVTANRGSEGHEDTWISADGRTLYTPTYENNVFHAGDTLEYEMWTSNSMCKEGANGKRIWPGDVVRTRKSAKIGAIISRGANHCGVITGLNALEDVNLHVNVWLEDELDEELQQQIATQVQLIAGRSGANMINRMENKQTALQRARVSAIVSVVVCGLLFAFTAAMLLNAVAGRIQSDTRQIGLMRAVGASKRVVFQSYARQFYRVFAVGGGIAFVLALLMCVYLYFDYYSVYTDGVMQVLLPLALAAPAYCAPMLLLCMLGVWRRLRPVFAQSVVENIRML